MDFFNNSVVDKSSGTVDTDIYFQKGSFSDTESKELKHDNSLDTVSEDMSDNNELPANIVSGTKIVEDVDISGVNNLLDSINSINKPLVEEKNSKALEEERLRKAKEDEEIKKRKEALLEEKLKEEAKHRELIKQQEEEELRLARESKKSSKGIKRNKKETGKYGKQNEDPITQVTATNEISKPAKEETGFMSNIFIKGAFNKTVNSLKVPLNGEETVSPEIQSYERENDTDWKNKAMHDELTGLKNSMALDEDAKAFPLTGAIIFADINNLKYVNDNLGHAAGNTLLIEIAKVLENQYPNSVYRIGGDEFLILTTQKESLVKKKNKLIQKKLDSLTEADKSGIIYSAAIGYAIGDGQIPFDKLKDIADSNMYEVKEQYKSSHPELNVRTVSKNHQNDEDMDWKSLAMIDQKTKLYNKLALSMHHISKQETISLIRIAAFSNLKRDEGDKQSTLLSEIIRHNINEGDLAYFLENGSFLIICSKRKTSLETIKIKARTLSLDTEISTLTSTDKDIEDILDILYKKLEGNNSDNTPKSYDDRLSLTQRKMKEAVRSNHEIVQEEDFEQMLTIIQRKANEIISVFMTSKDFNSLFIFFDVYEFLENIYEVQDSIDFSYIYAVYSGGALYYGADEYSNEISELFQKIAEGLQMGAGFITQKDIQRIEGINIFEKIYIQ